MSCLLLKHSPIASWPLTPAPKIPRTMNLSRFLATMNIVATVHIRSSRNQSNLYGSGVHHRHTEWEMHEIMEASVQTRHILEGSSQG